MSISSLLLVFTITSDTTPEVYFIPFTDLKTFGEDTDMNGDGQMWTDGKERGLDDSLSW